MKSLIKIPFTYGSLSKALTKVEGDNTHSWTIYVKFPQNIDTKGLIKKVSFKLHESFSDPLRTVEAVPFEVSESGWGEFQIQIRVYFVGNSIKPLFLTHQLKLYADDGTTGMVISEKSDKICLERTPELDSIHEQHSGLEIEGKGEELEYINLQNIIKAFNVPK